MLMCNSSWLAALTAKMLVPVLCFFLPFSTTTCSVYTEGSSSTTIRMRRRRGWSRHGGESCSLQKLGFNPDPNFKRTGREKKASSRYERMVREENETWWLPLSWLDREIHLSFAWEIPLSKRTGSALFPLHRMAVELLGPA